MRSPIEVDIYYLLPGILWPHIYQSKKIPHWQILWSELYSHLFSHHSLAQLEKEKLILQNHRLGIFFTKSFRFEWQGKLMMKNILTNAAYTVTLCALCNSCTIFESTFSRIVFIYSLLVFCINYLWLQNLLCFIVFN